MLETPNLCSVCNRPLVFPEGRTRGAVSKCRHIVILEDYQPFEHMPWMQSNRSDYNDVYNAGIAAASVALNVIAKAQPEASQRELIRECAKAVIALLRPVGGI